MLFVVINYGGTGADVIAFPGRGQDEVLLLPYFGQTEQDNWYLTYPTFQIAASNKGMDAPEREKLILDIMTAMVNQQGQDYISYGKNMVPYKKDVTLELMPEMDITKKDGRYTLNALTDRKTKQQKMEVV